MNFSRGQGGSGVRDMTPPLLGNLAANQYSERHSLIFSPILCNSPVVTFTQQFKTIDSNNFTLSSMFSFQNAWPIKKKSCVYFSTFPYIHSFPCGMYELGQIIT